MSWSEEWGEEKKRRFVDRDAEFRKREEERENRQTDRGWARQKARDEHHFAKPLSTDQPRKNPVRSQRDLGDIGSFSGTGRLAMVVEIAFPVSCPRCAMPIGLPGEMRVAYAATERRLVHSVCGGDFHHRSLRGAAKLRLAKAGERDDAIIAGGSP